MLVLSVEFVAFNKGKNASVRSKFNSFSSVAGLNDMNIHISNLLIFTKK